MPRRTRTPDGPEAPGAPSLPEAAAPAAEVERVTVQLYGTDPDRFVAEREAAVAALRAGGDRAGARAVAALRRPTQGAWLVNLLVREQPDVVEDLLALGEAMRAAGLDAGTLRALSAQRRQVVDALVRDAARLGLAHGARTSADIRGEVQSTLEAALLDAEVAQQVRGGRLERAQLRAGFPGGAAPVAAQRPAPPVGAGPASRPAARQGAREVAGRQERERRDREERARQEREEREREERERQAAQAAVRSAGRARDVARRAADEADDARRREEQQLEHLREQLLDAERRAAEAALTARSAVAELARSEEALAAAEEALAALAGDVPQG